MANNNITASRATQKKIPIPTDPPEWVFRVDTRDVDRIFQEGFVPLGHNRRLIDHLRSSQEQGNLAGGEGGDGFMSFTDKWETALRIAEVQQPYWKLEVPLYIYAVRADERFFSANTTMNEWLSDIVTWLRKNPKHSDYNTMQERGDALQTVFDDFQWQREWVVFGGVPPVRIRSRTIYRGNSSETANPWQDSSSDVVRNPRFGYVGTGSSELYPERPIDFNIEDPIATYPIPGELPGKGTSPSSPRSVAVSMMMCRPSDADPGDNQLPVCPAGMQIGGVVAEYDGYLFRLHQRTKAGKELVLGVKASDHGKTGPVVLEPPDGTGRQVWHTSGSVTGGDLRGSTRFRLAYDQKFLAATDRGGLQALIYTAQSYAAPIAWTVLPGSRGSGKVMIESKGLQTGKVLKRVSENSSELEFVELSKARGEDLPLLEWSVNVVQADRLPDWTDGYQVRMVSQPGLASLRLHADSTTLPGKGTNVGLYEEDGTWGQQWRMRLVSIDANVYAICVQKELDKLREPYAMAPAVDIKDPVQDALITTPYFGDQDMGAGNLMKWRAAKNPDSVGGYYFVNLASGMYLTRTWTGPGTSSRGVEQRKYNPKLNQTWYPYKK